MSYVTLKKLPHKLRISITPAGMEELLSRLIPPDENHTDKYNWNAGTNSILQDLLEDWLANGWEMVPPEDIAALTSAPILSDSVKRDDKGKLVSIGDAYWFPEYATTSELEELLGKGFVDFTKAS